MDAASTALHQQSISDRDAAHPDSSTRVQGQVHDSAGEAGDPEHSHVNDGSHSAAADHDGLSTAPPIVEGQSTTAAADVEDDPATITPDDKLPAAAQSTTPHNEEDAQETFWQELRQLRAKPLSEVALQPLLAQRYADFSRRYPHVDPSEEEELGEHIYHVRAQYPDRLNDAQREQINQGYMEAEHLAWELVQARAQASGIPIQGQDPEGRSFLLSSFVDGRPQYLVTSNERAAISSGSSWLRRSSSFDAPWSTKVDGSGLVVNVNDHGTIYEHVEFTDDDGSSRIIFTQVNDGGDRSHMTHVAGTIGARGVREDAMGMAPEVLMRSLIQQNVNHVSNFAAAYPNASWRSVMGNTSLGSRDEPYGAYNQSSRDFDNVLRDYPYYLHFYAAGNNGSYHTLSRSENVSKNTMTVG
ncbi:MAG: hypothetical protein EA401_13690, partial [Planctomycetota bacterium]